MQAVLKDCPEDIAFFEKWVFFFEKKNEFFLFIVS